MERFCPKCGALVEGNGGFCPNCGEKLESAVSLEKPVVDAMPSTSQPAASNTTGTYNSNNASAMPNYPQNYNAVNTTPANEMTVGQWVLTIFLSGLGIIGIILLFIWAFGSEPNIAKKNYAKAMLIWEAIILGLSLLYVIGMCVCGMSIMGNLFDELETGYYMFIR